MEEYLHLTAAADRLGISRPTVYAWLDRGLLTRFKIGDRTFVSKAEVDALKDRREE